MVVFKPNLNYYKYMFFLFLFSQFKLAFLALLHLSLFWSLPLVHASSHVLCNGKDRSILVYGEGRSVLEGVFLSRFWCHIVFNSFWKCINIPRVLLEVLATSRPPHRWDPLLVQVVAEQYFHHFVHTKHVLLFFTSLVTAI